MMMLGSYVDLEMDERRKGVSRSIYLEETCVLWAVNGLKYTYFFKCKKPAETAYG